MPIPPLARQLWFGFLALGAILAWTDIVSAQDKKLSVARCTSVEGCLLARTKAGGWEAVLPTAGVPTDRVLVALFAAEFQAANGAVKARLIADVGQRGPFPVLETAVRVHAGSSADLELTLQRGVAVFTNAKKEGPAQLRLHVRDEVFTVTLSAPKARLAVEVYGRHVPGPAKLDKPKEDLPVVNALFFALEGEVVVGNEQQATRLQAPPGASLLLWDSATRMAESRRFDKLPDSVKPLKDKEREKFVAICKFTKGLAANPDAVGKTLADGLKSPSALERKAAVVASGALDDLPRLWGALNDADHADVRDTAILVLRHWLGREPGQSVRLYNFLTKDAGLKAIQAKNALHLLHGLEEETLQRPATFDLLIQGLNHDKLAARELARWHLVRLVPAGKAIAYDAAAPEPQRLRAVTEWRRLVPEGQAPVSPKN